MALLGVRVEPGRLAGQLDAQEAPGVALQDRALQLDQQRGGERRRAHQHLLAGLHVEAVAGQQVREGRRVEAAGDVVAGHGTLMSGNHSAQCSRSTPVIQARSSRVATR